MTMKMTMAEFVGLEPCPFCGGEAFVRIDITLNPMQSRYRVGCDKNSNCHGWYGHSRYYSTEAEAIEVWNTRHERTCELEFDFGMTAIQCSKCHYRLPKGTNLMEINYCPNCGAKVVGE